MQSNTKLCQHFEKTETKKIYKDVSRLGLTKQFYDTMDKYFVDLRGSL